MLAVLDVHPLENSVRTDAARFPGHQKRCRLFEVLISNEQRTESEHVRVGVHAGAEQFDVKVIGKGASPNSKKRPQTESLELLPGVAGQLIFVVGVGQVEQIEPKIGVIADHADGGLIVHVIVMKIGAVVRAVHGVQIDLHQRELGGFVELVHNKVTLYLHAGRRKVRTDEQLGMIRDRLVAGHGEHEVLFVVEEDRHLQVVVCHNETDVHYAHEYFGVACSSLLFSADHFQCELIAWWTFLEAVGQLLLQFYRMKSSGFRPVRNKDLTTEPRLHRHRSGAEYVDLGLETDRNLVLPLAVDLLGGLGQSNLERIVEAQFQRTMHMIGVGRKIVSMPRFPAGVVGSVDVCEICGKLD